MHDFTPKLGPLSGGTKLVISGSNLNIGSIHSVLLAGQACNIEDRFVCSDNEFFSHCCLHMF